jgi:hypothetical protein
MVDADYCPSCKKTVDCALGSGERQPEKGDVTICAYCAAICTYDEDIRLTLMSDKAKEQYKEMDPQAWEFVNKAVNLIKQQNG